MLCNLHLLYSCFEFTEYGKKRPQVDNWSLTNVVMGDAFFREGSYKARFFC